MSSNEDRSAEEKGTEEVEVGERSAVGGVNEAVGVFVCVLLARRVPLSVRRAPLFRLPTPGLASLPAITFIINP